MSLLIDCKYTYKGHNKASIHSHEEIAVPSHLNHDQANSCGARVILYFHAINVTETWSSFGTSRWLRLNRI